jgi:FKBP-type peptidyl-prolyl cis-trans isomerase
MSTILGIKRIFMKTLGIGEWIAVAVGIAVALFMFFGGSITNFFTPKAAENQINNTNSTASTNTEMKNISTITGLEIYDETVGTGAVAVAGKTVTAHYVGTLANGTKFDSSVDRGQPFSFALGAGQVIKGWDLGIQGMKIGGKRRLVISPELGYGSQEVGGVIPANSTLVFDVELLGVK